MMVARVVYSRWYGRMLIPRHYDLGQMLRHVAGAHHVTQQDLKGPRRTRRLAHARQEFMWVAYSTGRFSLPRIGDFLNRDHTTILHGIRAHSARCTSAADAPVTGRGFLGTGTACDTNAACLPVQIGGIN